MLSHVSKVMAGTTRDVNRAQLLQVMHIQYVTEACNKPGKIITMDNLNPKIIKLEYAVRGPLVIRAMNITKELKKGVKKPFTKVINANIGDAHAMNQQPITFHRQVLSCVTCPEIINNYDFPQDVKERSKMILNACGGRSVGSYSASSGVEIIRRHVAEFIKKRDGYPADWNDVNLVAGASQGIKFVLRLLCNDINGCPSGVMVPIPQYPLYSAALAEYGLGLAGYFLDEDKNWGLDVEELQRALCENSKNFAVRAIVVINPGNPTGQVLTRENIELIIKFAEQNELLIFADEVYQHNIYAPCSKFHSFKKVMSEMGPPYCKMELASFMSCSKGYMGECGLRGGWMEVWNFDPEVRANLYKAMSANLCPPVTGQTIVDLVARPPQEGDPSYNLFIKEKTAILRSLKMRAIMTTDALNQMEGFKCNVIQGAMYAFPTITLPPKAIEEAKKQGKPADVFYAFKLLEETGICIVPGSGFGQKPGTYHFRTTILPQPDLLQEMLSIFKSFHTKFTQEFQ